MENCLHTIKVIAILNVKIKEMFTLKPFPFRHAFLHFSLIHPTLIVLSVKQLFYRSSHKNIEEIQEFHLIANKSCLLLTI